MNQNFSKCSVIFPDLTILSQPRALQCRTWWEFSPCSGPAAWVPFSWWSSWGSGSAATSARRGEPGRRSGRKKEKLWREDLNLSQTQPQLSADRYDTTTVETAIRRIKSNFFSEFLVVISDMKMSWLLQRSTFIDQSLSDGGGELRRFQSVAGTQHDHWNIQQQWILIGQTGPRVEQ